MLPSTGEYFTVTLMAGSWPKLLANRSILIMARISGRAYTGSASSWFEQGLHIGSRDTVWILLLHLCGQEFPVLSVAR